MKRGDREEYKCPGGANLLGKIEQWEGSSLELLAKCSWPDQFKDNKMARECSKHRRACIQSMKHQEETRRGSVGGSNERH
jgi:hypothetical protein